MTRISALEPVQQLFPELRTLGHNLGTGYWTLSRSGGGRSENQETIGDGYETMSDILTRLALVLEERKQSDPETSYVARLYAKGQDAILKKIGEEATETVMAAKDGDPERITAEIADLWFHCLVLLAHQGLGPEQVLAELDRRFGLSGIAEKAARSTPS